jgi:hypothetical protein
MGVVLLAVLSFMASAALYIWLVQREYEGDSMMQVISQFEGIFVLKKLINGDGEPGSWWIYLGSLGLLILAFVLLWV